MRKLTLSQLTKKLDKVFSEYIRRSQADSNGNVTCVCCGKVMPWQESQCMHYISRSHRATRWDELNCHGGCVGCNVFKNGNYPAYTQFYMDTYGTQALQALLRKKDTIKKWTIKELQELTEYYSHKIKGL